MIRIRRLDKVPSQVWGGAVTIGNFDGVHCGHARIVERLREQARRVNGPAVVFTFNPPPAALLRPDQQPPPLTWLDRKARLLAELGVDVLIEFPTTRELLELSAREFFDQILCDQLRTRGMVEGPNFLFGRNRQGDVRQLAEWCRERGMEFEVLDAIQEQGEMVSSSRVRQAVQQGDVAAARNMLTRGYRVRGTVVRGAARGAQIGFPTANLTGMDTLLPAPGVYAGRAYHDGKAYGAAIHLGPIPTFDVSQAVLEVHLLDFQGDLYGESLEVEWIDRVRDVQKFSGIEALRTQLQRDIVEARRKVADSPRVANAEQWWEVRVGSRQATKSELIRAFARQLRFPEYARENWDSWEECLADLSWLPSGTGVHVFHDGEPLADATDHDRAVYHDILAARRARPFLVE